MTYTLNEKVMTMENRKGPGLGYIAFNYVNQVGNTKDCSQSAIDKAMQH